MIDSIRSTVAVVDKDVISVNNKYGDKVYKYNIKYKSKITCVKLENYGNIIFVAVLYENNKIEVWTPRGNSMRVLYSYKVCEPKIYQVNITFNISMYVQNNNIVFHSPEKYTTQTLKNIASDNIQISRNYAHVVSCNDDVVYCTRMLDGENKYKKQFEGVYLIDINDNDDIFVLLNFGFLHIIGEFGDYENVVEITLWDNRRYEYIFSNSVFINEFLETEIDNFKQEIINIKKRNSCVMVFL